MKYILINLILLKILRLLSKNNLNYALFNEFIIRF
jgi:hypothetical protein